MRHAFPLRIRAPIPPGTLLVKGEYDHITWPCSHPPDASRSDVMQADEMFAEVHSNLSEVARALFASGTVEGTMQVTVDLAVATIDGCDEAGIFVLRDGQIVTAASSSPLVLELDELQFAAGEGPCLDVVNDGGTSYAIDLADDTRWQTFGASATKAGIRSALALRLSANPVSVLNLYARLPAAFGATDRAKG